MGLAFVLTLGSAALCAVYGFLNWNKPAPAEEAREIAEEEAWEKAETAPNARRKTMNATVAVTTLFYLAITAALGYLGYRQTTSAKDYLLAGRKVHPVIMAVSYGSTFISTAAIVGFGGAAAVFGMGILWLTVLNIFLGIFIAFIVFGKRTRGMGHKLDAHTFPEFLGKRFDSTFLQVAAAAVIFIAMPLYAGAVMLGGVSFLTVALGLSQNMALLTIVLIVGLYVMFGGMKGVLYTDAFQGGIMVVGMAILLWFAYSGLGGCRHRPRTTDRHGRQGSGSAHRKGAPRLDSHARAVLSVVVDADLDRGAGGWASACWRSRSWWYAS